MKGLILALALAVTVGCGSLPKIPALPDQVPAVADSQVITVAGNLQQLLTMSARVVNTVSLIEDEAARNGAIPAAADAKFDAAMVAYTRASDAASNGLASGALKTWPELKALVEPVLQRGQVLIDTANSLGAIQSRVRGFLLQLRDLLGAAAGEFLAGQNFGGGR